MTVNTPLEDLNRDGEIQTEEIVDYNNLLLNELVDMLDEKGIISKDEFISRVRDAQEERS